MVANKKLAAMPDIDGGVLREMTLPETLFDLADEYLTIWGFRDATYRIQRPLWDSIPGGGNLSNRRPLVSRGEKDTGLAAFLKTVWPEGSDSDIQALISGHLPWSHALPDTRQWILSQIPSQGVFTGAHKSEHMAQVEWQQCQQAVATGQFIAIVCVDTKEVYLGRWALKILLEIRDSGSACSETILTKPICVLFAFENSLAHKSIGAPMEGEMSEVGGPTVISR